MQATRPTSWCGDKKRKKKKREKKGEKVLKKC